MRVAISKIPERGALHRAVVTISLRAMTSWNNVRSCLGGMAQQVSDVSGHERANSESSASAEAFRLTGYFLERDVFQPRGLQMPQARQAYLAELTKIK